MVTREATITRILGQSFTVGEVTVTLVAVNKTKARLVVKLPGNMDIEDNDDYRAIVKSTLVMRDDHGWYRPIPRRAIELPPSFLGGDSKDED